MGEQIAKSEVAWGKKGSWRDRVLGFSLFLILGTLTLSPAAMGQKSADELIKEAANLLQNQQADRAIDLLRKADRKGDDFDVKMYLATAYNKVGAYKTGIRAAHEALDLATDDFQRGMAENLLGISLFAGGSAKPEAMSEAAERFSKAYDLSEGEIKLALLSAAEALLQLERDDEAIPLLEQYIATEPRDRLRRGRAEALLENPQSARTPMLPSFGAALLDGEYITNDDLEGKVVLFDFWGTWCAPCRAAIPHLKTLSKRRGKQPFEIVSVSSDKDAQTVRSFVEAEGMDWPQIWEEERELISKLQVTSYPTYILVNHKGEIVLRESGWGPRIGQLVERELNAAVRLYRKDTKRQKTDGR